MFDKAMEKRKVDKMDILVYVKELIKREIDRCDELRYFHEREYSYRNSNDKNVLIDIRMMRDGATDKRICSMEIKAESLELNKFYDYIKKEYEASKIDINLIRSLEYDNKHGIPYVVARTCEYPPQTLRVL